MLARSNQGWPLVSVIMPVRNEQRAIKRSLSAVLRQDYPTDYLEVLIADGRSDDETRTIVSELAARDARVRLIDNPGANHGGWLQYGAG